MTDNEPGSEPLRGRKERFAVLLAAGGLNQLDAYCQSVSPPVEATKGRAVASSRLANDGVVQDRILFLKREIAGSAASDAREQAVTSANLMDLMDSVSATLRDAVKICEKRGEISLSQRMRSTLLQHVSRHIRAHMRVGKTPDDKPQIDTGAMLDRLQMTKRCNCG